MGMRHNIVVSPDGGPAPIDEHGGKVYQYVGCTIVITGTVADGPEGRP